jgi:hypothetical protein
MNPGVSRAQGHEVLEHAGPDACEHRWIVMFWDQQKRPHRGLRGRAARSGQHAAYRESAGYSMSRIKPTTSVGPPVRLSQRVQSMPLRGPA